MKTKVSGVYDKYTYILNEDSAKDSEIIEKVNKANSVLDEIKKKIAQKNDEITAVNKKINDNVGDESKINALKEEVKNIKKERTAQHNKIIEQESEKNTITTKPNFCYNRLYEQPLDTSKQLINDLERAEEIYDNGTLIHKKNNNSLQTDVNKLLHQWVEDLKNTKKSINQEEILAIENSIGRGLFQLTQDIQLYIKNSTFYNMQLITGGNCAQHISRTNTDTHARIDKNTFLYRNEYSVKLLMSDEDYSKSPQDGSEKCYYFDGNGKQQTKTVNDLREQLKEQLPETYKSASTKKILEEFEKTKLQDSPPVVEATIDTILTFDENLKPKFTQYQEFKGATGLFVNKGDIKCKYLDIKCPKSYASTYSFGFWSSDKDAYGKQEGKDGDSKLTYSKIDLGFSSLNKGDEYDFISKDEVHNLTEIEENTLAKSTFNENLNKSNNVDIDIREDTFIINDLTVTQEIHDENIKKFINLLQEKSILSIEASNAKKSINDLSSTILLLKSGKNQTVSDESIKAPEKNIEVLANELEAQKKLETEKLRSIERSIVSINEKIDNDPLTYTNPECSYLLFVHEYNGLEPFYKDFYRSDYIYDKNLQLNRADYKERDKAALLLNNWFKDLAGSKSLSEDEMNKIKEQIVAPLDQRAFALCINFILRMYIIEELKNQDNPFLPALFDLNKISSTKRLENNHFVFRAQTKIPFVMCEEIIKDPSSTGKTKIQNVVYYADADGNKVKIPLEDLKINNLATDFASKMESDQKKYRPLLDIIIDSGVKFDENLKPHYYQTIKIDHPACVLYQGKEFSFMEKLAPNWKWESDYQKGDIRKHYISYFYDIERKDKLQSKEQYEKNATYKTEDYYFEMSLEQPTRTTNKIEYKFPAFKHEIDAVEKSMVPSQKF